jgi:hypothetical protein
MCNAMERHVEIASKPKGRVEQAKRQNALKKK